jgi:hypothetical protein
MKGGKESKIIDNKILTDAELQDCKLQINSQPIDCDKQIVDINLTGKISEQYYNKLSHRLESFIETQIKHLNYIPDKTNQISYCTRDKTDTNDTNMFKFELKNLKNNSEHDNELNEILKKKQENKNVYLQNYKQKRAFLNMLLLRTGDFITVLSTFLLNIFKNVKYSIEYKKFINSGINSPYIYESDIPESLLYDFDQLVTFICKKKISYYIWLFGKNKYTYEFKYFITTYTDVFIEFINKAISQNAINIAPDFIIKDLSTDNLKLIQKENKINSIVNYFVIINHTKVVFNEVFTSHFSKDKEYMDTILDKFITLMNKYKLPDLYLKGGQVFKMNVLEFIKKKPNIKLYDEKNNVITSKLKYSDWDFSYKIKKNEGFVKDYTNFANKVQKVFSEFRSQEQKTLDCKYKEILSSVCDSVNGHFTITENNYPDNKIYYVKDIPTFDIKFDNFIFDKNLENITDRCELLQQMGRGGYNLYVLSNDVRNKHKITHLEILSYINNPVKTGINLIRLNSKFKICVTLNKYCCINFISFAEIFDIATNKPNSFNNNYDLENVKDIARYTDITHNGKKYKSYSLIWYVLDVIYMYITDPTIIVKKIVRMFNVIEILLNTSKKEYNHLFTIKKQEKSVRTWLNEIADANKDKLHNYKKYKELL